MADTYPDWASFTPETAAAELDRLLKSSEVAVSAVEAGNGEDFVGFVHALDDATRGLWLAWGMVSHMNSVANSPEWRKVEEDFQERIVAFSLRVSQSPALYARAKKVRAACEGESPARKRILDRMILDAELAGVALGGDAKRRFNAIQAELAKLSADFANSVIDATAAFKFEKDGRTYTIDDAAYVETMRECPDREVREALCRARSARAPENAARIARILELRRECASLLGFGSYAELSIASKCAPSPAAVMDMIDRLDAATAEPARIEAEELASVQDPGAGPVMPWDGAFLAERLKKKKHDFDESDLKKHLEFSVALAGLFKISHFLFGIDIEEVPADEKPSVWHPDTRFFRVFEDGKHVADFYMDPYVRPGRKRGGAWMNSFRNRNDAAGAKPLALFVLNLKAPDAEGKTHLSLRELETLFHEFGHALQCMLTRIGEEDAAGGNLVEWDAIEVASQFMENWCLDPRTGIELPAGLKAKVLAAKNFRAATACRRQLAFAKTDIMLHAGTVPADADAIKRENFIRFGVPMTDEDRFLCAFTHIFASGYAAGYYGYKWSEVMSADCYGAFEEAGLDDDAAAQETGRRYRETILGLGGSQSALDTFKDFRGRAPEIGPLLRQTGLAR